MKWKVLYFLRKFRIYATLAFMVVVIIVGVPMWWKTTEVSRVSLPNTQIMSLQNEPIQIALKVGIYSPDEKRSQLLVEELSRYFCEDDTWKIDFVPLEKVSNADNVKTPAALEKLLLQSFVMNSGDFLFIEWAKLGEDILLTTDRSALMSAHTSASKIQNVLKLNILQSHKMNSVSDTGRGSIVRNSPPQPQYDIVVSILNPRPDLMNVKWNAKMATEVYLESFLKGINQVSNFSVRTQWKYQVPFEFSLKQIRDDSKLGRHYSISEEVLPHIITSIEKNLGGGISVNPVINLVVYVPPCDIAPLHLYKTNGERSTRDTHDSFISPKWGGIIIYNPPLEACLKYNDDLEKVEFAISTTDVMQIMLGHLYKLLDLQTDVSLSNVKMVDLEQLHPRAWEFESFVRRSAVNHIVSATQTLQSLVQLLDNINYIVINDDVGEAVNNAYLKIVEAKQFLRQNNLLDASIAAKEAFISAEQAFFDASLLAQLYFPNEQKYAIYIPLFLPIMFPVMTSFNVILKLFSKKP